MKQLFYLSILLLLFTTVACEQSIEKENIKDSNLPETNLEGDWTVNAYINENITYGPFTISAQKLSEDGVIHIKDNGEFWNFQTKLTIGESKNKFEAESSVNEISSIGAKINIINGSIIDKDSITFDIQFEDDETPYAFIYKIKGCRKS